MIYQQIDELQYILVYSNDKEAKGVVCTARSLFMKAFYTNRYWHAVQIAHACRQKMVFENRAYFWLSYRNACGNTSSTHDKYISQFPVYVAKIKFNASSESSNWKKLAKTLPNRSLSVLDHLLVVRRHYLNHVKYSRQFK